MVDRVVAERERQSATAERKAETRAGREKELATAAKAATGRPVRATVLLDTQARCRSKLAELDPSSTVSRIDDFSKGGFPGGLGDGRRSANKADPGQDKTDALMDRYRDDYYTGWRRLERQLDALWRIDRAVLEVFEPKPWVDAMPCANTYCTPTPEHQEWGFLSEDDLERGFTTCAKCRKHRERHGQDWPHKTSPGLRGDAA